MPDFKVSLNGRNFRLRIQGKPQKVGFFAARFVSAASEKEAQDAAIGLILGDPQIKTSLLNKPSDAPEVHIESVVEATPTEEDLASNNFYSFYPDDPGTT